MRLVTSNEMFLIENKIFDEYKIPSIILMEQAGKAVADFILNKGFKNVIVFSGKGNNGGDGFVAARYLFENNVNVKIYYLGDEYKEDALINLNICKNLDIPLYKLDLEKIYLEKELLASDCIIDGIFGIGFKGEITPEYANLFKFINNSSRYIVSIDIPSGVNGTSGKVTNGILANTTITFGFGKIGLYLYPGYTYSGQILVSPISIPKEFIEKSQSQYNLLTTKEAYDILPKRSTHSNKGSFGKVHVFCGSNDMVGAGVLVTKAALKIGSGYVISYGTEKVKNAINNLVIEAVTKDILLKSFEYNINENEVIAIGSGIGLDNTTKSFFCKYLEKYKKNMVIDGDGLTILSENIHLLKNMENVILTPHPKEMARLVNLPIEYIISNPIEVAKDFALKYKVTLLLKSERSIIIEPSGRVYINPTGNSSLAKAGTGDVLTGIIVGLMSQGLSCFKAGVLGSFIHGLTGELTSKEFSEYSVLARDLIENLGQSIKKLKDNENI